MTDTSTYAERTAREIGREHGSNAASWVELDEATAQAIDDAGSVFDVLEPSSPLSGEWADGYSVEQLAEDCGIEPYDERALVQPGDDLATEYEDAYWQAFEAEVERKVETMRGLTLDLDPNAPVSDYAENVEPEQVQS